MPDYQSDGKDDFELYYDEMMRETGKAILFRFEGREDWIPKSQIRKQYKEDDSIVVVVPKWLARSIRQDLVDPEQQGSDMTVKRIISVDDAVKVLNRAALVDPEGMTKFINNRTEVNWVLANDRTIQVAKEGETFKLGFLGLLNGLFGIYGEGEDGPPGHGAIAAMVDDKTGLVIGFVTTKDIYGESQGE